MVIPGIRWPLCIGLIITYMTYSSGAPPTSYRTKSDIDSSIDEELIGDNMVDSAGIGYSDDESDEVATSEKDKIAIQALQDYARNSIMSQKRLSPGFYGSRGKKMASPNAFYGSRGKKFSPSSFYGSRGKRSARSNARDIFYAGGKRIDPNSFFGMRGKRTEEESFPLLVEQQQYYKTIPQQTLPGDEEHYFYDSNDDSSDALSYYPDSFTDNNGFMNEMSDKEKLLALVDYYLSLKKHKNSSSAYRSSLSKVKRQPPTGFHAIRGK